MSRGAEASQPQGLPVAKTGEPKRPVADRPGTQKRRRLGVGDDIGDGVGEGLGDRHEFRIASVCIASCGAEVRTEVLIAGEAVGALPAGRKDPGHPHASPDGEASSPRVPFSTTRPTTWWPGTTGSRGGGVRPSISSSLRVADPAGRNPDQGLPVPGTGHRKLYETQGELFVGKAYDPIENHRFHQKPFGGRTPGLPAVPDTDYSPAGALFHEKKPLLKTGPSGMIIHSGPLLTRHTSCLRLSYSF